MTFFICVELEWFHCRKFHTNRTLHHWSFIPSAQYGRIRLPYESEELAVLVSARERIGGRGYFCRGWRETDKFEFILRYLFTEPFLDKGFCIADDLGNRLTGTAQGEDLHNGKASDKEQCRP